MAINVIRNTLPTTTVVALGTRALNQQRCRLVGMYTDLAKQSQTFDTLSLYDQLYWAGGSTLRARLPWV